MQTSGTYKGSDLVSDIAGWSYPFQEFMALAEPVPHGTNRLDGKLANPYF
jgi:hypothetical protein